jgi:NAD(P)-dependent dehydrogenase (short-subunit alcohol dehydrogenase family)
MAKNIIMIGADSMYILISGADRGLGFGVTKNLLEGGHIVFAGQFLMTCEELDNLRQDYKEQLYMIPLDVSDSESVIKAKNLILKYTDKLDMIISNAGIFEKTSDQEGLSTDYDYMMNIYNVNAIGGVRLTEVFLDLLGKSKLKRICFVSSEAGSITQAKRTKSFSYCMSKAALNMYGKLLHNRLQPLGYSIRLYHPGWIKSYMSGELSSVGDLTIEEGADHAIRFFFNNDLDETTIAMYGYDGEEFQF